MKLNTINWILLAILCTGCAAHSQSSDTNSNQVMLIGLLEQHQWSKTSMSYCAGGSDYWTLTHADEEGEERQIVLKPSNGKMEEDWLAAKGVKVRLWGVYREVEKKASDTNPMEQRPVGDVFRCRVFEAVKWELVYE